MYAGFDTVLANDRAHERAVAHIASIERNIWRDSGPVTARKVVENHDRNAALTQQLRGDASHVTSPACNKYAHDSFISTRCESLPSISIHSRVLSPAVYYVFFSTIAVW